jgi:hypothetical protein
MPSELRSETVSRRAGCGKSARPDPWGAWPGNWPGLPDPPEPPCLPVQGGPLSSSTLARTLAVRRMQTGRAFAAAGLGEVLETLRREEEERRRFWSAGDADTVDARPVPGLVRSAKPYARLLPKKVQLLLQVSVEAFGALALSPLFPLPAYSAPEGLRQDPGRAAGSLAEARLFRNGRSDMRALLAAAAEGCDAPVAAGVMPSGGWR